MVIAKTYYVVPTDPIMTTSSYVIYTATNSHCFMFRMIRVAAGAKK